MGDRAGATLTRRRLKVEENRCLETCSQNYFLPLTRGHSHDARDDVHRSSGGKADQPFDGPAGVVGGGDWRGSENRAGEANQGKKCCTCKVHSVFPQSSCRCHYQHVRVPDLVIIGSHCTGLDLVTAPMAHSGLVVRSIAVGSLGGLAAAKRGECDLAPIHLFDEKSETYNTPYLTDGLELVPGWRRMSRRRWKVPASSCCGGWRSSLAAPSRWA